MKYFYYINIIATRKREKENPELKALFYVVAANALAISAIMVLTMILFNDKSAASFNSILILVVIGTVLALLHIPYYYNNREKILEKYKNTTPRQYAIGWILFYLYMITSFVTAVLLSENFLKK